MPRQVPLSSAGTVIFPNPAPNLPPVADVPYEMREFLRSVECVHPAMPSSKQEFLSRLASLASSFAYADSSEIVVLRTSTWSDGMGLPSALRTSSGFSCGRGLPVRA